MRSINMSFAKRRYSKLPRLVLIAVLLSAGTYVSVAQQHIGYTQFSWDPLVINPAYAGSREALSARLFYRNQWTGLDGAPQTQSVSVHSPFSYGAMGAGLVVLHDRLGVTDQVTASGSFAYHMKMDQGRLAFGLSAEFRSMSIRWSQLNPANTVDEYLPVSDFTTSVPNFGFGMFYYSPQFYAGVSIPWLLERDVSVSTDQISSLEVKRHLYLMSGYVYKVNENFELKPAVMVRMVPNSPLQVDVNVSARFNKTISAGASYRLGDSGDLMLQYQVSKQLVIGYAYDFTFTKIQNHAGSHEFFLGFDLQRKSDGYNHPRFF